LTVSYPSKYPLGEKSANTGKGVSLLAASCLTSGKSAASSSDKFVIGKKIKEKLVTKLESQRQGEHYKKLVFVTVFM